MRDLDQLQEHDPEERGRRAGALIMAAIVTAGLTLAIGQVIGQASDREASAPDPLDRLERSASAVDEQTDDSAAQARVAPKVDTTKLTFERALTEHEDRPEVIAALEAAAREESALTTDRKAATAAEAKPTRATGLDEPDEAAPAAPPKLTAAVQEATDDDEDAQYLRQLEQLREEGVVRPMPAGMTATAANRKLQKVARHDTLVAQALPKPNSQPRARAGEDGEFTLQVISYDTNAAAQAFANGLRSKGHEAFVASGDVDGRGRYYRVRIGPFKTKQQADAYRHTFEAQERMNTIVVKRVD